MFEVDMLWNRTSYLKKSSLVIVILGGARNQ